MNYTAMELIKRDRHTKDKIVDMDRSEIIDLIHELEDKIEELESGTTHPKEG